MKKTSSKDEFEMTYETEVERDGNDVDFNSGELREFEAFKDGASAMFGPLFTTCLEDGPEEIIF